MGLLLKQKRLDRGLTQQNLADLTGINIRSIQNYEQGKNSLVRASYDRLKRISIALNCDISDFLPVDFKKVEKGVDNSA